MTMNRWTVTGAILAAMFAIGCGDSIEPFVGSANRVAVGAGPVVVVSGHTSPNIPVEIGALGPGDTPAGAWTRRSDAQGEVYLSVPDTGAYVAFVVTPGGDTTGTQRLEIEGTRVSPGLEVGINGESRCTGGPSCMLRFRGDIAAISVVTADPGTLVSSGSLPPQTFAAGGVNVPAEVPSMGALPLRRLFDSRDRTPVVQVPVRLQFPDGAVVDSRVDLQADDARTLLAKQLEGVTRGAVPLTPEGTGAGVVAMYARGAFFALESVRDAPTVGDIALVAMVSERWVRAGSCGTYGNGSQTVHVERGRTDATVTFYDRRTGVVRSTSTMQGPSIACPAVLSRAATTVSEQLSQQAIRTWIAEHIPE
jgi:hypothetical protein